MSQFDDATQEACLFLLKNRDKWNRPDAYLRFRTFYALIRQWQNEHKARRRRRLSQVDAPLETIAVYDRSIDARDVIETAIQRARLENESAIVWELVDRRPRREVAAEHGTTVARVTEIYKRLVHAIGVLSDEPLPDEEESCPLFYPERWTGTSR